MFRDVEQFDASRDVIMRKLAQLKEVKVELQLQQSEINSPRGPSTLSTAAEKNDKLANKIAELAGKVQQLQDRDDEISECLRMGYEELGTNPKPLFVSRDVVRLEWIELSSKKIQFQMQQRRMNSTRAAANSASGPTPCTSASSPPTPTLKQGEQ